MKKKNIVKKNYDFERIIKSNNCFKTRLFILYVEKNESDNYSFGISVGKKLGIAVTRNLFKRRIKNIIDQKNYKKGFNCIIILRKEILSRDFLEMQEDLFYAFNKLNLFKENIDEQ